MTEKAEQQLKNYQLNESGLVKLVKEKGGEKFLDSAVKFAKEHPKVNFGLKLAGINAEKAAESIKEVLKNDVKADKETVKAETKSNAKDRLKKLK